MLVDPRHPSGFTVPRLGLLAVAALGAMAAFALPPAPPAQPSSQTLRCQRTADGWEGVERIAQRMDGGIRVLVEHCRRGVGWRRWRHRVRATVTRGDRTLSDETIFEATTTGDGVDVRFVSIGSPLQIRYECGNLPPRTTASHTCTRRWRWSDHRQTLIVTSPVR